MPEAKIDIDSNGWPALDDQNYLYVLAEYSRQLRRRLNQVLATRAPNTGLINAAYQSQDGLNVMAARLQRAGDVCFLMVQFGNSQPFTNHPLMDLPAGFSPGQLYLSAPATRNGAVIGAATTSGDSVYLTTSAPGGLAYFTLTWPTTTAFPST